MAVSFCLLLSAAVPAPPQGPILQVELEAEGRVKLPRASSLSFPGTVRNVGAIGISGLDLFSAQPTGWNAKVIPETIELLDPGAQKPFTLEVAPPRTIFGERQYLWVKVQARVGGKYVMDSAGFVAVLSRWEIWASVGGILAIAVVICFILIYRRFSQD